MSATLLLPMDYESLKNKKENGQLHKVEVYANAVRFEQIGIVFDRWLQISDEWRSGRKSPYQAMRPGTRTTAIQSYGLGQRLR